MMEPLPRPLHNPIQGVHLFFEYRNRTNTVKSQREEKDLLPAVSNENIRVIQKSMPSNQRAQDIIQEKYPLT